MNGRECPVSHVRNLLSVEIKKCMYLAVFEVSWSSKREREREKRKKRIGTEFRRFLFLNLHSISNALFIHHLAIT